MKKLLILLATTVLLINCDDDNSGKSIDVKEKSSTDSIEKKVDPVKENKDNLINDESKTQDNDLGKYTDEKENPETGWPEIERRGFIKSCEREAVKGGVDKYTAESYCLCMLEKMEKEFPDINKASKLTNNQLEEFTNRNKEECLEEH